MRPKPEMDTSAIPLIILPPANRQSADDALWRRVLPPDPRLAIGEAVALGVVTLAVIVYLLIPTPLAPVETALAAPTADHRELPPGLRERLLARFPGTPLPESEQLLCMSRLGSLAAELGLLLEERQLDDIDAQRSPPRRPVRMSVIGTPQAQIEWVRQILSCEDPVVIRELSWTAGTGPEERSLALVVEIFAR